MTTCVETDDYTLEGHDDPAAGAIRAVRARYPDAVWFTAGDYGRIVQGDRLISLAVPLIDTNAEQTAWCDAASRLG